MSPVPKSIENAIYRRIVATLVQYQIYKEQLSQISNVVNSNHDFA